MRAIISAFILISACFLVSISSTALALQQDNAPGRDSEVDKAYANLLLYLPRSARLIHAPYANNLYTYGPNLYVQRFKDQTVTGGKLLRVKVKRQGEEPYSDAISSDVAGEIHAGDVIFVMFWGRISPTDKKNTEVSVPLAALQKASPPFNKIVMKDVVLKPEWETFAMAAVAKESYGPYETNINFPISTGKHILDFGPVFVFNLGPDVNIKHLPFLD